MKYFLGALGLGFTLLIFWAMSENPMNESFNIIISDPWGIVTLADLYLGFVLFIVFIFKTSKSLLKATVWSLLLLVLGNVVAVVYAIKYLSHLDLGKGVQDEA